MTGSVDTGVAALLAALPLTRLTHFTPALNLPCIVTDQQLRSVKDMSGDARACYRATDLHRLDGYPDKVCCSLQYPNGFYFDIARRKADVINTRGTLFCPRNAAASAGCAIPAWPA